MPAGSGKCRKRPVTLRSGPIGSVSKRSDRAEPELLAALGGDGGDLGDAARAVGEAVDLHDHVDRRVDLVAQRLEGDLQLAHRRQRLQAVDRVVARVGVHGHQRALVAGVERLQHVERLAAADLADDDPVGAHAQRVAHEVADRDLAAALDVGRAGLERDDVRLLEAQLGVVLDGDDALRRRARRRDSALSSVVLPAPVPPEMTTFSRASHERAQQRRPSRPSIDPCRPAGRA